MNQPRARACLFDHMGHFRWSSFHRSVLCLRGYFWSSISGWHAPTSASSTLLKSSRKCHRTDPYVSDLSAFSSFEQTDTPLPARVSELFATFGFSPASTYYKAAEHPYWTARRSSWRRGVPSEGACFIEASFCQATAHRFPRSSSLEGPSKHLASLHTFSVRILFHASNQNSPSEADPFCRELVKFFLTGTCSSVPSFLFHFWYYPNLSWGWIDLRIALSNWLLAGPLQIPWRRRCWWELRREGWRITPARGSTASGYRFLYPETSLGSTSLDFIGSLPRGLDSAFQSEPRVTAHIPSEVSASHSHSTSSGAAPSFLCSHFPALSQNCCSKLALELEGHCFFDAWPDFF